jgi:type IV pilus assembly protein PilQ
LFLETTTAFSNYYLGERKMKKLSLLFFILLSMGAEQYSVEIRDAPISDVIRLLVSMDNQNVVLPGDLSGTVIASFSEISLDNALKSILESNQLVGIQKSDVLAVTTQKSQEALGKNLNTVNFNLKYARSKDVGAQAKALLAGSKGTILIDDRTNSMTIRATQDQLESIQTMVSNVDKLDKQVLIEAKVVDAEKRFTRSIGIQWGVNGSVGPVQVGGLNATGMAASGRPLNVNTPGTSNMMGISTVLGQFGSTFIDAQLTAGEENGTALVLARPSIVTMNNQPATIQSGVQFYIRTAGSVTIASGSAPAAATSSAPGGDPVGGGAGATPSGASTGNNLQQVTTGITLIVTPHITPDNKISLTINVVSSQIGTVSVGDIPTVNNNSATTTVLLENGATTVIGGLATSSKNKSKSGVPWLSNLPVIGALFGRSSKQTGDRELLIFITPTVVEEAVKQMRGFSNKKLNQDDGRNAN